MEESVTEDKRAQQRPTRMLRDWSTCSKREAWQLLPGERKGLGAAFYLQEGHGEDGGKISTEVHGGRARDNRNKMKQEKFTLGIKEAFFPMRTIQQMISWHPFQPESDPSNLWSYEEVSPSIFKYYRFQSQKEMSSLNNSLKKHLWDHITTAAECNHQEEHRFFNIDSLICLSLTWSLSDPKIPHKCYFPIDCGATFCCARSAVPIH